jgi:hypothetical protein
MPKVIRLMADAPDGRVFICPDLPQADARIVAWDAQCERLIELFLNPAIHFHLENVIRISHRVGNPILREVAYGKDDQGVPWKDREISIYTLYKAMGHAANYRMQARKLAMELGVEIKLAALALMAYKQIYPEIERWQYSKLEQVKKKGYLETPWPFLRRRTFYQAWAELMLRGKVAESSWNEICAHTPQSSVADIVNVGMEKLWLGVPWARLHKHDHDSYLASVPVERLGESCAFAMEALKVELRIHDRPLVMVPEMQYSTNYGTLIEWKGESEPSADRLSMAMAKATDEAKVRKALYGYF